MKIDIEAEIGKRYGRLVVVKFSHMCTKPNGRRGSKFLCQCDCGKTVVTFIQYLRSGDTASCGCYRKEIFTVHGMSQRRDAASGDPEYRTWYGMIQRCTNPKVNNYKNYGGRGIKVCDEWRNSFQAFYDYIGPRPEPKHLYSIDRINNDGDYEPGNVRWATAKEQANNKRNKK